MDLCAKVDRITRNHERRIEAEALEEQKVPLYKQNVLFVEYLKKILPVRTFESSDAFTF